MIEVWWSSCSLMESQSAVKQLRERHESDRFFCSWTDEKRDDKRRSMQLEQICSSSFVNHTATASPKYLNFCLFPLPSPVCLFTSCCSPPSLASLLFVAVSDSDLLPTLCRLLLDSSFCSLLFSFCQLLSSSQQTHLSWLRPGLFSSPLSVSVSVLAASFCLSSTRISALLLYLNQMCCCVAAFLPVPPLYIPPSFISSFLYIYILSSCSFVSSSSAALIFLSLPPSVQLFRAGLNT